MAKQQVKIYDLVPYLLTGEKLDDEKLNDAINHWHQHELEKQISQVEARYMLLNQNQPISDYVGILIFTDIIKKIRSFSYVSDRMERAITFAQKRVLHYHHLQYERQANGKNPQGSNPQLSH